MNTKTNGPNFKGIWSPEVIKHFATQVGKRVRANHVQAVVANRLKAN